MSFARADRYARVLIWASPLWAVLLLLGTLDHQPPPQTQFADYAQFTTTTRFLVSHLVASILGAGIGTLGFIALFQLLTHRGSGALAIWALITSVLGNTLVTAVFGTAAFAQPAIGRLYLSGQTAQAMTMQDDIYGVPLTATALVGLLLLNVGLILFGIAVVPSGWLPRWAGVILIIAAPLFALVGVILADVVQTIGAARLVLTTAWIAISARRSELATG
jgi:hypothetical protein